MECKICIVCDEEFIIFSNSQKYCSEECVEIRKREYNKNYGKEYYKKNKKEIKEKREEYSKEYYSRPEVIERREEYNKEYLSRPEVKEKKREYMKEYTSRLEIKNKRKKYKKEYIKEKCKTDPFFRLNSNISSAIRKSLKVKGISKAGRHWEDLVGYTAQQLKSHLESLFEPGMSWDKLLNGDIHVDHIVPKSFFEYKSTDDVEFRMCWRLENLQPLWAQDNLSKNDSLNWSKSSKL